MRARRWGRIVNISSIGARIGSGSVSVAYGASKAGVEGLTRSYALRLAPEGITVNAVAPGLIDTGFDPLPEETKRAHAASLPLKRLGMPEDLVGTVMWLVSDASSFVTGQTIAVDGGTVML